MRLKPHDGHIDASRTSDEDQTMAFLDVSSSCVTWQNFLEVNDGQSHS